MNNPSPMSRQLSRASPSPSPQSHMSHLSISESLSPSSPFVNLQCHPSPLHSPLSVPQVTSSLCHPVTPLRPPSPTCPIFQSLSLSVPQVPSSPYNVTRHPSIHPSPLSVPQVPHVPSVNSKFNLSSFSQK